MNIDKLEKERETKIRKQLKEKFEQEKLFKQIRKNNEDRLKEKLGIQKTLEKFHSPVTKKIENYEKSNKDVVKSIQDAIENISPLDVSSRMIEHYTSDAGNMFDRQEGIFKFYSDKHLDIPFIKKENLELPSELVNKSNENLDEIITIAKEKRDTYKRLKGTHSKNFKLSNDENDKKKAYGIRL